MSGIRVVRSLDVGFELRKFVVESLTDDTSGLRCVMCENRPGRVLRVAVSFATVEAYRSSEESLRLASVAELPEGSGLYQVEDSDFLPWLRSESFDTMQAEVRHYAVVCGNQWIDVASLDDPMVAEVSEGCRGREYLPESRGTSD